jgi:glycosyltransferase involved in cell wall biosynthesis
MRLGLVVTGGFDRSGCERVIPALLWLVERLARRHDVHVFVLDYLEDPCTYPLLGATIHDLGTVDHVPGPARHEQLRRLTAELKKTGPLDLLHAYWAMPAGFVTTLAAERLGIPSVVTVDSGEWISLPHIRYGLQRRWLDRSAVRMTMRRASRVTVCTDYMARLAESFGVPADVIPLGVPQDVFMPVQRAEGSPWRLIHVASINPVKDHQTLLEAMALVVKRVPDVHLDIVGEDTIDGVAQQFASSLGLDRHVTFHGFLPTDALVPLFQKAHLHVVSSRHEAAGVVTLEAAASGVPTVGTAVGYVADWAAEGDRAVGVPVGDAGALGAAIVALLGDPDRRARIADAARAWTLEHDADWTAKQFDRLYAVLGGR